MKVEMTSHRLQRTDIYSEKETREAEELMYLDQVFSANQRLYYFIDPRTPPPPK